MFRPAESFLLDIELERLELPADGVTTGALSPCSLLLHEDLDASLAESTDALCARKGVAQS